MKKTLAVSLLYFSCFHSVAANLVPGPVSPPLFDSNAPQGITSVTSRLSYTGATTLVHIENTTDKKGTLHYFYTEYYPETGRTSKEGPIIVNVSPHTETVLSFKPWTYNLTILYYTKDTAAQQLPGLLRLCSLDNPYFTTQHPNYDLVYVNKALLFEDTSASGQLLPVIKSVYPTETGYKVTPLNIPRAGNCATITE